MIWEFISLKLYKDATILNVTKNLNFTADSSITPYDPNNGFIYLFYQRGGLLYYAAYNKSNDEELFIDNPLTYGGVQISLSGSVSITSLIGPPSPHPEAYMAWTTNDSWGRALAYVKLNFPAPQYPSARPVIPIAQVILSRRNVFWLNTFHYSPSIIYKETAYGGKYLRIFYCISKGNETKGTRTIGCYAVNLTPGRGPAIQNGFYPVLVEASDGSGTAVYATTASTPQAYSHALQNGVDLTDVYVVDPVTQKIRVVNIDTDHVRKPTKNTPRDKLPYFWINQQSLLSTGAGNASTGHVADTNMAVSISAGVN